MNRIITPAEMQDWIKHTWQKCQDEAWKEKGMNKKDLPRLNDALNNLYSAISTLCKIEGTLAITNMLADGTIALERRIIELEDEGEAPTA